MSTIYNILKEIKKEKIQHTYSDKGRLIDVGIYNQLKSAIRCQECKKKFQGRTPQIHHKIPVSKGGQNTKENLLAVCKKCHEKLDKEALK